MPTLIFNSADAKRVIEHSIMHFAKQRPMAYTTDPVKHPSVILVHDQGVYLMSNAAEPDLKEPGKEGCFAAYAEGCHPEKDEDWWDAARDMVGGDDFAETLDWAIQMKQQIDAGAKKIKIRISRNRLELLP